MSKPQITIKDIARELGVSPSTVSRALKDNPDISQETRDAIHKYAREHNYKPNVLALNLRTSRSNTIGVIIPQLVHHFFSCVHGFAESSLRSPKTHPDMTITRNCWTTIFLSFSTIASVPVSTPNGWW